jgi:hypothetical protein
MSFGLAFLVTVSLGKAWGEAKGRRPRVWQRN